MSSEKRLKVMVVFGTRPEAIKMAPLIFQLKKEKHLFETKVVVTSQHRELLDQVCQVFGIVPDYDLDVMSERQSLVDVTTVILEKLDAVLKNILRLVVRKSPTGESTHYFFFMLK